jgi:cadmium resistance protein CadD (predicted permease)
MITLCITCLVGVYFGFYYGFLVLIPVTLVAAVAGSAVHGEAISSILLTILAQAIGLQGGYMIGLTGRDVLSQFVARRTRHV